MATINGKALVKDGKPLDRVYSNGKIVYGRNYILKSKRTLASQVDANDTGWVDTSIPISTLSDKIFTISVQVEYDNVTAVTGRNRIGMELVATKVNPDGSKKTHYFEVWRNPKVGESFHGSISTTFDMTGIVLESGFTSNHWGEGLYIQGVVAENISISNPKIEMGNKATDWTPAPEDYI